MQRGKAAPFSRKEKKLVKKRNKNYNICVQLQIYEMMMCCFFFVAFFLSFFFLFEPPSNFTYAYFLRIFREGRFHGIFYTN